jgi:predicted DNA-binding transcriptional regulator AlpA
MATPATYPSHIDGFIGAKPAAAAMGISITSFYRKIQAGEFPRGTKLSQNRVGWRVSIVSKYLDQLSAAA